MAKKLNFQSNSMMVYKLLERNSIKMFMKILKYSKKFLKKNIHQWQHVRIVQLLLLSHFIKFWTDVMSLSINCFLLNFSMLLSVEFWNIKKFHRAKDPSVKTVKFSFNRVALQTCFDYDDHLLYENLFTTENTEG